MKRKRIALVGKNCVACGRCAEVCPVGAISIHKGLRAVVELAGEKHCIGCGKCERECPAGAIALLDKIAEGVGSGEGKSQEKALA